MRLLLSTTLVLLLVATSGCESSPPAESTVLTSTAPPPPQPADGGGADAPADAPAQAAPAHAAPAHAAPPQAAPGQPGQAAPAPAAGDAAAAPPAAEGGGVEKAQAGVGEKGRDYGGPGFVTTPIETLFRTEDRIVFEVQIPKTMQLYKAEHDNKGPKSHEEFMQTIIVANQISLPELPAGDVYWYDAKSEQLMVKHPTGK